ncbi:MAG: hypothetical protein IJL69_07160 [Oscillospiraceae bacterium]|nr:hypothetical protein [Oscillospiraceae bacterium]
MIQQIAERHDERHKDAVGSSLNRIFFLQAELEKAFQASGTEASDIQAEISGRIPETY